MRRHRTILLVAVALFGVGLGLARAQIVITDPATTARNAAIAVLKNQILGTLTDQGTRLRRMARRLSAFTNLDRYSLPDPPRWRIYRFQDLNLYANPYNEALNSGDRDGASFEEVARKRAATGSEMAELAEFAPAAELAITAELATLDLADSTIIAGTHQNGQLRSNGRREIRAIDALERDAIDPSPTQSATAVLEKISGAGLIRARQQQARLQFLTAIVEQLLVDNKRSRDAETAVMNMRLEGLRDGRAAGASLITGAGDNLRNWRQP